MEINEYRARLEEIFAQLGDNKLSEKQHAHIAGLLGAAFVNGFHAALNEYAGISSAVKRMDIVSNSDTVRHVMFLTRQNSI
jgi:hypothetical protein